jgi:hypothetical protein
MSDPTPESPLTPAQDDAVRALLASAKHTDPVPADVVARLEATLASLGDERRETPVATPDEGSAPVVTLASRRRRTAATLVLAAAAVVVAGVGIGQVLPSDPSSDSAGSAESATSAEDRSSAESDRAFGAEGSAPGAAGDEKQGDTSSRSQEAAPEPSSEALTDLRSSSSDAALEPQVRALRRRATASTLSSEPLCPLPGVGAGTLVSVTYDGLPGALVFRAPVGGTQQVDVFRCGERGALRSLQVPAP